MLKIDFKYALNCIKGAKKIGIQLPDGLKFKSSEIAEFFEKNGFEVLISGESCYGACDIDMELLNKVDYLLHFCHTQIFEVDKVVYVPCFYEFEVEADKLKELEITEKNIALISTAQYAPKLEKIKEMLEKEGYYVELKSGSRRIKFKGQVLGCNYTVLKNTKADAILFIGDGLFHAIGAAIYSGKKVYAYSPITNEFRVVNSKDFLSKRYLVISKTLHRDLGAILVSTKVGQQRLGLALKLKRIARKMGKKLDVVVLNEINPYKLDNLPYQYYVNTACPRISYDDVEMFKKPIITPQELEIILSLRSIDDYELDEIE